MIQRRKSARVAVFFASLLWSSPAFAQDTVFSTASTEACTQEAVGPVERRNCIGASARQCIAQNGSGAYIANICYDSERAYWDDLLNASYAEVIASDPALADIARGMQRAWLPYRDARCEYAMETWGEGTGQTTSGVACLMTATAEQVLILQGSDLW